MVDKETQADRQPLKGYRFSPPSRREVEPMVETASLQCRDNELLFQWGEIGHEVGSGLGSGSKSGVALSPGMGSHQKS